MRQCNSEIKITSNQTAICSLKTTQKRYFGQVSLPSIKKPHNRFMSTHDPETDLIVGLKVVGKLRTHERISSTGSFGLEVETNDRLQSFRRWYRGENRHHNVDAIASLVTKASNAVSERLGRDRVTLASLTEYLFLGRLARALVEAQKGLRNLAITYKGCPATVAHIEHVIDVAETERQRIKESTGYSDRDSPCLKKIR